MNICVIPARGGSKRIPKKNIRNFHGQPIIAYSIQSAINSGCFEKVIVSTDDPDIAAVAMEFGADAPFERPAEISDEQQLQNAIYGMPIEDIEELVRLSQEIYREA